MKTITVGQVATWAAYGALALMAGCLPESIELEHGDAGVGGEDSMGATGGSDATPRAGTGGATAIGGRASSVGGSTALAGAASGAPGGRSGSATGGGPAGGGTTSSNSTGGGAAVSQPGDPCDTGTCSGGFFCFSSESTTEGRCAPLCNEIDQTQWGLACENSLTGEPGTCVSFHVPQPGRTPETVIPVPEGLCSDFCDPLAQDCPDHFSCALTDLTDRNLGGDGSLAVNRFACLPIVAAEPLGEGAACDGYPVGQCAEGLDCIQDDGTTGDFANCRTLCNATTDSGCAADQSCQKPSWFPDGDAGVCVPAR
jgi:hypothetical protein